MQEHLTKQIADGFIFLEGPRWHENHLWVSDMWGYKVYRVAADGSHEAVIDVPNRPAGLGFLPDGTPLVVSMVDRKVMKISGGQLDVFADLGKLATGDLNDLMMDPQGRAYVGNFGYDLFGGADPVQADLFLIDADGSCSLVADDLNFPNGSVLIDGGDKLIIAETWANRLTVFDRKADGSLDNRQLYADLGERTPDGICVDVEDGIWVSSFITGEFIRVAKSGEITDRVFCEGKRAVACALGGEDGRTLFCSTFAGEIADIHARKPAGAIEIVRVGVPAPGIA